jgi:hypothetical protein
MRVVRTFCLTLSCAGAMAICAVRVSGQTLPSLALVADRQSEEAEPSKPDYWVGVRCAELPPLLRAQLDLPDGQGVLVEVVVPGSPAEHAGLKDYDVIFSVDGKAIADPQALAAAVGRAGDNAVKIDYLRAGRKQTVSVKPAPRPDLLAPREEDQRSIRQWFERLGHGAPPMNFRFFQPGKVLPPGASLLPPLPDGMTVTIEKDGGKAAKITAKQGDEKWEASEDGLDNLPPEARQFAERVLGLGTFNFDLFQPAPAGGPTPPSVWPPNRADADARLNKRLDDLNRQIDELRQAVEKLRKE